MRPFFLPIVLTLSTSLLHGQQAAPGALGTRLVDLDGDGALDMLVHHADGTLLVRQGAGPRRFLEVVQELPRVVVTDVLVGDLDGDDLPDLYVVSPGADVALVGEGGGHFREATAELGLSESGVGLSAERLDADGDGIADLLVHNQGSDVLFWARPGGGFEREERTLDGVVAASAAGVVVSPEAPSPLPTEGGDTAGREGSSSSTRSMLKGFTGSGPGAAGSGVPTPMPTQYLAPFNPDARYVNDNENEVDSADIVDGSLTGADVSTSSGDVTFGGGATVTAEKGVFGVGTTASGQWATVSGGNGNSASFDSSTVSGGLSNTASASNATVSGGTDNTASGSQATVSGGSGNTASSFFSTVSGGRSNTASGDDSIVPGGRDNNAAGDYSFAAGRRAKANHQGAFVWGDGVDADKTSSASHEFNVYAEGGARVFAVGQTTPSLVVDQEGEVGIGTSTPDFALEIDGEARAQRGIFGVNTNASGYASTVSGGQGNTASGNRSTVSGGYGNVASYYYSTVSGGIYNAASNVSSTVSGGVFNIASGYTSTVSGGRLNTASYLSSTVAGGRGNTASESGSTVSGGSSNTASANASTVSGGSGNTASGSLSTVPGGHSNIALGHYSFAAGRRAKANHQGAFVWGDSVNADKASSASDQFNVYASGGARIFSNSAATTGVLLAAGGGSWTSVSDENAKENFEAVDAREVLERLAEIPISTWNYKSQDDAIRHMGPMAQDFWEAFGLGLGDTSIDTIDPDGVALAAIQGLDQKLARKDEQIAVQALAIARLRADLDELRETLGTRTAR